MITCDVIPLRNTGVPAACFCVIIAPASVVTSLWLFLLIPNGDSYTNTCDNEVSIIFSFHICFLSLNFLCLSEAKGNPIRGKPRIHYISLLSFLVKWCETFIINLIEMSCHEKFMKRQQVISEFNFSYVNSVCFGSVVTLFRLESRLIIVMMLTSSLHFMERLRLISDWHLPVDLILRCFIKSFVSKWRNIVIVN